MAWGRPRRRIPGTRVAPPRGDGLPGLSPASSMGEGKSGGRHSPFPPGLIARIDRACKPGPGCGQRVRWTWAGAKPHSPGLGTGTRWGGRAIHAELDVRHESGPSQGNAVRPNTVKVKAVFSLRGGGKNETQGLEERAGAEVHKTVSAKPRERGAVWIVRLLAKIQGILKKKSRAKRKPSPRV